MTQFIMCAFSQFNIIVGDRLQPIEEISEGDPEGYDGMPELIDDDLPDLEPIIERPEDDENTQEEPQEEPQQEERQPIYETQQHQELLERLYYNLRVLYEDSNV